MTKRSFWHFWLFYSQYLCWQRGGSYNQGTLRKLGLQFFLAVSYSWLINARLRVSGSRQHEVSIAVFLASNSCFWWPHCGYLGFRFTSNRRGELCNHETRIDNGIAILALIECMCLTLKPARARVSSNLDQLTNDKGQSEARHMGRKELIRTPSKNT